MSKCKLLKPVTYVQYLDIAFLQLSHIAITVINTTFCGIYKERKKFITSNLSCLPNFM